MDLFDILLQAGLITTAIVVYLTLYRNNPSIKGFYRVKGWNYPLKIVCAWYAVKRWKGKRKISDIGEEPQEKLHSGLDCLTFRTSSPDGATVVLSIRKLCDRKPLSEVTILVKLSDGTAYKFHTHPDTAIGDWIAIENSWTSGGLKFQILEPQTRIRIIFNGLLNKVGEGNSQPLHAKFNFMWSSISHPVRYPDDWSDDLAAKALALEPWRDDYWTEMLGMWNDGSWLQWGAIQGRFESFDSCGSVEKSEYLRVRGVKERSWSPLGYQALRRSVTIMVAAVDGVAIQLRALSYRDVLTEIIYGSVRYPDYSVKNITDTDFVMADFCENPGSVPKAYTIQISTKGRTLKLAFRTNSDAITLFSGVPYQQQFENRTVSATIDGVQATGLLELGYEPTMVSKPSYPLIAAPTLRWRLPEEVGEAGYCLRLDDPAATCPAYVGGKSASLALLASVQKEEGWHMNEEQSWHTSPGFCLTVRALNRQIEANPELRAAIRDIEMATEKYDENNFRNKCESAVKLFENTEIVQDVKEEILSYLDELTKEAVQLNLGSEVRFAVRSSGVCEDGEALSAAGQNATVLGCLGPGVLSAVKVCWGSLFAFHSAHYRRENGQPCASAAGVAVQVLVRARTAGVMFTRHPSAGDPNRILITANYGLGESVVSGSVEPDTIEVNSDTKGYFHISKIEVGSKTTKVNTSSEGVSSEEVSESERRIPCLTESEALSLAQWGSALEQMWGAARDIEWAIAEGKIYFLQARPITSLEMWTEEELLHELDFPIMADDEIISFGNAGEVLPNPISSLSYDLGIRPLIKSILYMMNLDMNSYERGLEITHNRLFVDAYNVYYARMAKSKRTETMMGIVELATHGHRVADDNIKRTACTRRPPHWTDNVAGVSNLVWSLLLSGRKQKEAVKLANSLTVHEVSSDDKMEILNNITNCFPDLMKMWIAHSTTTTGNNAIQIIAVSVMLEGNSDFTPEQCNEISTLLTSGDVLSAEVPVYIAKLSRKLEESGLKDQFRALDPNIAMGWLQENLPDIHTDVNKFLQQHGYRGIGELDIATKPWSLNPEKLIEVLQNMQAFKQDANKQKSDSEIVSALKTPKKSSTRFILRWLLPFCRQTVRYRETTKAHLVLSIHKQRLAVRKLASVLVKQWYLPDPELIFHFRLHELQQYLASRDPAILKKAKQRMQYYPRWCKLRFKEICVGWPQPESVASLKVTSSDFVLRGTSVCAGEVIARACVVREHHEIVKLQKGDVLITHATDIGWSPYYPLISGVVTELGGLISHGAVIAREYGLPAIVGAINATDLFNTGDLVRLSGTDGTVQRVQLAEDHQNESMA